MEGCGSRSSPRDVRGDVNLGCRAYTENQVVPFAIYLTDKLALDEDGNVFGQVGQIVIGEHSELFDCSLEYWSAADYARHWRSAAQRIVDGHERACLLTSVAPVEPGVFLPWWLVYAVEDRAIFREALLLPEVIPIDLDRPFEVVPPRDVLSGAREWTVTIADLAKVCAEEGDDLAADPLEAKPWTP